MVVLLGGAALGSRLGMASQVLYLVLGMAGLPVFAASPVLPQGIFRLLGPTGGYLMSYPFAAFLTGFLAERGFDRRYLTSVLAMAAGLAVIFACGVLWLAWFARPAHAGLDAALRTGLYPFLPADIVKICLAAAIMPGVWALLGTYDARSRRGPDPKLAKIPTGAPRSPQEPKLIQFRSYELRVPTPWDLAVESCWSLKLGIGI